MDSFTLLVLEAKDSIAAPPVNDFLGQTELAPTEASHTGIFSNATFVQNSLSVSVECGGLAPEVYD